MSYLSTIQYLRFAENESESHYENVSSMFSGGAAAEHGFRVCFNVIWSETIGIGFRRVQNGTVAIFLKRKEKECVS